MSATRYGVTLGLATTLVWAVSCGSQQEPTVASDGGTTQAPVGAAGSCVRVPYPGDPDGGSTARSCPAGHECGPEGASTWVPGCSSAPVPSWNCGRINCGAGCKCRSGDDSVCDCWLY